MMGIQSPDLDSCNPANADSFSSETTTKSDEIFKFNSKLVKSEDKRFPISIFLQISKITKISLHHTNKIQNKSQPKQTTPEKPWHQR